MTQLSLSDREALWFPAHMSAGDSFSRPTGADGAPLDSELAAEGDDGIGLPGRRGGGSGKPPKNGSGKGGRKSGHFRAAGWLWITLCGVTALGIVGVAARKEIAANVAEGWLKGQGVTAHVKVDTLSLSHVSGNVLIGDVKKPEMQVERFDIDYSLNLFGSNGLPLARVHKVHLVRPSVAVSIRDGKFKFGSLDKIVQDVLSAPPSNAPPPEDILIENAVLSLDSDYGLLKGRGGVSLHDGLLTSLDITLPATHLSGTLGTGDLRAGRLTARSVNTAKNGDQLEVRANLVGDNWTVKGGGNLVETIGAEEQRFHVSDVVFDLVGHLPYRHSKTQKTSMYEAFSGATDAVFDLRAAEVTSAGTTGHRVSVGLTLGGQLKTSEKGVAYSGGASLLTRAANVTSVDMRGDDLAVAGDDLTLNTGFSSETGLAFNLNGPVTGDAGLLRQGDLLLKTAHLSLSELAMTSDSTGAKANFTGGMTVGQFTQGDLSLDQTALTLNGSAEAGADAGPWNLSIKSDVSSDHGQYRGLRVLAKGRVDARAEASALAAGKPPIPGAPSPLPPDAIIALDRAVDRFSLRARGVTLSLHGDSADAPAQMEIRVASAEALLAGGGKATLVAHPSRPLLATGKPGAFGLSLTGSDGLPQLALNVDGLDLRDNGLLAGDYTVAAQFDFDPIYGAKVEGHGRFNTTPGGGFEIRLADTATFTAQQAVIGDYLQNLSATLTPAGKPLFVYTPNGWAASGAYRDLALTAPNEIVSLSGGEGAFDAYSLPGDALGYQASLDRSTLIDGVPENETRFNPLLITGTVGQDRKALTGRFFAATPAAKGADGKPLRIAAINLDSDNASGAGSLSFKTLDLNFTPETVQPAQLSPLVAAVFSRNVNGPLSFEGAFDWTKTTSSSGGVLTIGVKDFVAATETAPYGVGMSFFGATGNSQGLTGQITFTSLAPLQTEPGQKIHLARTELGVPLADMDISLQILGDHMRLESATVQSPGGPVRLEPTDIYFDGKTPISSILSFDGLDFGQVIAASDLGKSMRFKGNVTGHLPFTYTDGHLAFKNGTLAADGPGQISIYRTAVTGVNTATGSVTTDAPPATAAMAAANAQAAAAADPNFNPFQDLAFQAMEYITYEQLDARLNSREDGILNTNFHIKGYFDPPQTQKAKISLFDYISGKWMQKPIKLPSKTPVELYLEVPFNLDEFLGDITNAFAHPAQKPPEQK